jgi:ubiquitin conjugation factor E4 B
VELGSQQLVPRLLADTDTPEGLPLDFIQELAARVDEEGFEQVNSENTILYCVL